ncbi:MAG: acylphosphatase [Oceanospirillum sp.]|nr:acylphosphatase [Oceanospirillum sp.]
MQKGIATDFTPSEPALVKAINVSGRVQGVWFRKNTLQQAQKRQLEGWVMNLEDGSVQVHLQGPESQVQDMIDWLWKGSPLSRVDHLDIVDAEPIVMAGFEIR